MKNVVKQIDSPCIKDIAEKETVTLKQAVRMNNMNKLKEKI